MSQTDPTQHDLITRAERVERTRSPELDAVLGVPTLVLDQGFVRPVDYLGSQAAIVRAARVSYGAGTKTVREDAALVRYLLRNKHTSPFEMCELVLHVRVPVDCWRQWIRTRTASVNEYSTRYSEAIDANAATLPGKWRLQSKSNKQGSDGLLDLADGEWLSSREAELQAFARQVYQERLAKGVAREQARKDLLLSNMTEAYWKIDLHNLLHFLRLRMDPHAQLEIRAYAEAIGKIVEAWMPDVWSAFRDHVLEATTFSGPETRAIAGMFEVLHDHVVEALRNPGRAEDDGAPSSTARLAQVVVRIEEQLGYPLPRGELQDFAAKLRRLGLSQALVAAVDHLVAERAPKRQAAP